MTTILLFPSSLCCCWSRGIRDKHPGSALLLAGVMAWHESWRGDEKEVQYRHSSLDAVNADWKKRCRHLVLKCSPRWGWRCWPKSWSGEEKEMPAKISNVQYCNSPLDALNADWKKHCRHLVLKCTSRWVWRRWPKSWSGEEKGCWQR